MTPSNPLCIQHTSNITHSVWHNSNSSYFSQTLHFSINRSHQVFTLHQNLKIKLKCKCTCLSGCAWKKTWFEKTITILCSASEMRTVIYVTAYSIQPEFLPQKTQRVSSTNFWMFTLLLNNKLCYPNETIKFAQNITLYETPPSFLSNDSINAYTVRGYLNTPNPKQWAWLSSHPTMCNTDIHNA
jgi:hypothetical protein